MTLEHTTQNCLIHLTLKLRPYFSPYMVKHSFHWLSTSFHTHNTPPTHLPVTWQPYTALYTATNLKTMETLDLPEIMLLYKHSYLISCINAKIKYNTFHAASEFIVQFRIHFFRALPVAQLGQHTRSWRRNGIFLLLCADKGLLLNTSSVLFHCMRMVTVCMYVCVCVTCL